MTSYNPREDDSPRPPSSGVLEIHNEGPPHDLVLAVNHYISTGDHLGEGLILGIIGGKPGDMSLQIPFDPDDPTDSEDAQKLHTRLTEIRLAGNIAFDFDFIEELQSRYQVMLLNFHERDARLLARELVRKPGAAGWGSMKAILDEHAPEVTAKLLSEEGV